MNRIEKDVHIKSARRLLIQMDGLMDSLPRSSKCKKKLKVLYKSIRGILKLIHSQVPNKRSFRSMKRILSKLIKTSVSRIKTCHKKKRRSHHFESSFYREALESHADSESDFGLSEIENAEHPDVETMMEYFLKEE